MLCEKPLGRDADEAYEIWQRAAATGVKHMCAFNYRFVPAVRLAREMIDAGELGEIHHFRGRYLQDVGRRPAARRPGGSTERRPDRARSATSALTSSTSARYLVGRSRPFGALAHVIPSAPAAQVDDAFAAASSSSTARSARSRRHGCARAANRLAFEINGSRGRLRSTSSA